MKDRIASIDVFRALTIFTMIFVNDLASVRDIPGWMKHAPGGADAMTFVDIVFPAFLFIVGMSIPFALARRSERGERMLRLCWHILTRSVALLTLGILMVNIHTLNPAATGMSRNLWMILMLLSAVLVWNTYPSNSPAQRRLSIVLRTAGIAGLMLLAAMYRSGDASSPGWMQTSWWGILGLIGWSYLACSIVYLLSRGSLPILCGSLALWVALYIGDKAGALAFLGGVNDVLWLGGHVGGHASITTAGMIIGVLFQPSTQRPSPANMLAGMFTLAGFLAVGGFLLRPLYGISKNMATPAWSLYSAAICCILYGALYWVVDVQKMRKAFNPIAPAGSNPLLAYILPDIFYGVLSILGITFWSGQLGSGAVGIVRSLVFSFAIVVLTGLCTRIGIRLKL